MEETLRTILEELRALQEGHAHLNEQHTGMEEIVERMRQSFLHLELTESPRIAASLDGIAVNEEAIHRLEHRVARLERELGRQSMELVAAQLVNG